MTEAVHPMFDPEVRCEAGQTTYPTDCTRHSEHYWCDTCRGFYGVPHDGGMHDGPRAHPNHAGFRQCACRVCKNHVAELDRERAPR